MNIGRKKTIYTFDDRWLDEKLFSELAGGWLLKKNYLVAYCKLCRQDISLSNMGLKALVSHTTCQKHTTLSKKQSQKMTTFFSRVSTSTSASSSAGTSTSISSLSAVAVSDNLVAKAEIIWALKASSSHYSFNSNRDLSSVFKLMFPDSSIAQHFGMSYDKMSYYVNYGLFPVFHGDLVDKLRSLRFYSISFDESLNTVLNQQQMDLHVRYWDDQLELAVTQYFGSVFLNYSKAEDLNEKFKDGVSEISKFKIQQISMDGPNVNWKFLRLFTHEFDESDPQLISTGSCGLHIVNNAFKRGAKETQWNLHGLFRCAYLLFHSSPARQADFRSINGQDTVFPHKFCGHRWLENGQVAQRMIDIWPEVCKYVRAIPNSNILNAHTKNSDAFQVLETMVKDPLILAKLHFFLSITNLFQPFLFHFQSDKPMLPFLNEAVSKLLHSLLKRIVKPGIIEDNSEHNLCVINVKDISNRKHVCDVDLGTGALVQLNKAAVLSSLTPKLRASFLASCQSFLVMTISLLQVKSPISHKFVRNSSCLSPTSLMLHPDKCKKTFRDLAIQLHTLNRLSVQESDLAIEEFGLFCDSIIPMSREHFQKFSFAQDRLDRFYFCLLKELHGYDNFKTILKMVFTTFHGNADVERGFSVNKETLKANLGGRSLNALRTVSDVVSRADGVHNIEITDKMIKSVQSARARYRADLAAKKGKEEDVSKKRKATEEKSKLKEKRMKLLKEISSFEKDANTLCIVAEAKECFTTLAKANVLRHTIEEKKCELTLLDKAVN